LAGRHELAEELQPLGRQLHRKKVDSGRVAAGTREAGDQAKSDRVFGDTEHDRYRRGGFTRSNRSGRADRSNDLDLSTNEIGHQLWQPFGLVVAPAIFDREILALDIATLFEPLAKGAHITREPLRRC
jgi:hypothetical protein